MQGRIQAMALVHEKLYRTQNLSSIDLRAYIEDLVPLVEASHHAFAGDVNVNVEAESIEVLFDAAVPCGLILTELLSNAYKHAFKSEGGAPSRHQPAAGERQRPGLAARGRQRAGRPLGL